MPQFSPHPPVPVVAAFLVLDRFATAPRSPRYRSIPRFAYLAPSQSGRPKCMTVYKARQAKSVDLHFA